MYSSPVASRHRPKIKGASIPPPVGGLNARDELANMDARDAVVLTNYFPDTSSVKLRNGFDEHVTGITGTVGALMEWRGPTTQKLFAANASAIYDVSSAGAVGAAAVSTLSNSAWSHTMMTTSGGNFLVLVNGADGVRTYDGSTWATQSITGATAANLNFIWQHKRRLWFVEKASTSAWYLPVDSIAGAATELDIGPLLSLGGRLVAGASWTLDGGAGLDDYLVMLSSAGQLIVYQGTDPSDANAWALVGVFRIAPPINSKCFVNVGGDLAILTIEGIVSLQGVLQLDRAAADRASVTNKINALFAQDAAAYGGNNGWQMLTYPKGKMAIVNVPTSSTTAHQYVMNALTGAWCKFTGMNATCWARFNEDLFFASGGTVYKADTGTSDNGVAITGDILTAFNYLNTRGQLKQFLMIRPIITATGPVSPAVQLNFDFKERAPTNVPLTTFGGGALWDTAKWDVDVWAGSEETSAVWSSSFGMGYCAAVRMKTLSTGVSIKVNAFDLTFQPGAMGIS